MATAEERDALRADVARTNATAREAIEKQYVEDRNALEQQYHEDLNANSEALREAYVAAGLNSDGSDPQGRPVG
jgi:hypothetical protein